MICNQPFCLTNNAVSHRACRDVLLSSITFSTGSRQARPDMVIVCLGLSHRVAT